MTPTACEEGADRVIDVHRHIFPACWIEALRGWIERGGAGEAQLRAGGLWSVDAMLRDMDENGIAAAILSLPNPGADMSGPEKQAFAEDRRLARFSNLANIELIARHRDRLGLLAAVPMRDTDAALEEAAFALDELGADGICLYTSADDIFLGDDRTTPLLEELNRRGATLLIHPATPTCCAHIPGLRLALLELPFDTTRAIARLKASGAFERYAKLRFIFCHGGGALPYLAGRLALLGGETFAALPAQSNVFYDIALNLAPQSLDLLGQFARAENVVLGTDHPFGSTGDHLRALEKSSWPLEARRRIASANARQLFPRLSFLRRTERT